MTQPIRIVLDDGQESWMEPINLYMDDVRIPPIGWTVARTVADAKRLLTLGIVDKASFDHDMGICDDCAKMQQTDQPELFIVGWCPHASDGTELALWIVGTGHWPKQYPEVHSMNPVGRIRMASIFERYWPTRAFGPV